MHRFQISVFGAVAIVFSVQGVNDGIFESQGSLNAMGAGWLLLAIVNILWILYFTSEEDSLALYIFNMMGTGGLSPPSRRRRATRGASMHMAGNGYTGSYAGGGIGPGDMPYDAKIASGVGMGMNTRSNPSIGAPAGGSIGAGTRSLGQAGSVSGVQSTANPDTIGASSPLMGSGNAGIGAGGGMSSPEHSQVDPTPAADTQTYKAKALYACQYFLFYFRACFLMIASTYSCSSDTASPDDPNEISFTKGEILEIIDKQGKWWQAKKEDGSIGSEY